MITIKRYLEQIDSSRWNLWSNGIFKAVIKIRTGPIFHNHQKYGAWWIGERSK